MEHSECMSRLRDCVSADEVWSLMGSVIMHERFGSRLDDDIVYFPSSTDSRSGFKFTKDLIGLSVRIILYLKIHGELGHIPLRGGVKAYAEKYRSILSQLKEIRLLDSPSDITSEILDKYIQKKLACNIKSTTVKQDIFGILEWAQYGSKLPFFLRLNTGLFDSMKEYNPLIELVRKQKKKYVDKIGGSRSLYSLSDLAVIMQDAIYYVENYAEDSLHAAVLYKRFRDRETGTSNVVSTKLAVKYYKSGEYIFNEPLLKKIQEHSRTLIGNHWERIEDKELKISGPIRTLTNVVRKLQAACLIIVLMLTAMRKQELDLMERYPSLPKTEHTELDESRLLTRLIYKTAFTPKGETLSIPVPLIVGEALNSLSRLSEIMDGKKTGVLNFSAIEHQKTDNSNARINNLINAYCEDMEINNAPTPHQLRHSMAFLVSFMNDSDGLELVRHILGHKSFAMSQKYQGHFNLLIRKTLNIMANGNPNLQEALVDLEAEESKASVEKIIEEIEQDHPMVGPIARRIIQFQGNLTDEAKDAITRTLRLMVNKGMLAVLQTPVCYCFHDLTNTDDMACQRGFSQNSFVSSRVQPAACEGAVCPNSLYTRQNVEALKEQSETLIDQYPKDLRERLETNTYYVDDGLQNTHINIIKQYEKSISKKG